jgi:hypothetical protein
MKPKPATTGEEVNQPPEGVAENRLPWASMTRVPVVPSTSFEMEKELTFLVGGLSLNFQGSPGRMSIEAFFMSICAARCLA